MICRAGASPAIHSASGALALQFFNVFTVDNPTRCKSAVNDVQRPLFDIERGFSDGFA
jgi:hypothetical protein